MWIVEVIGEQPTRLAVGCKDMAEKTRDVLAREREVKLYEGPLPVRDDAEKARAQLLIALLVKEGGLNG